MLMLLLSHQHHCLVDIVVAVNVEGRGVRVAIDTVLVVTLLTLSSLLWLLLCHQCHVNVIVVVMVMLL